MDSGWNIWVCLVGVVSSMQVQYMGVVIWWWVWLECIGVVSRCCYKESRYIDFLILLIPILHLY